MGHIETTPITLDDKVFSTAEILAAAGLIGSDEQLSECLAAGAMSLADLANPLTKISLNQQALINAAFNRVTGNSLLSLQVGKRLHLTSYGIVGFAMLSSATLRDALETASQYGLLINLKMGLQLHVENDKAVLQLSDQYGLISPENSFWYHLEVSKLLTLLQDILGRDFTCDGIELAGEATAQQRADIQASFGVPVRFDRERTAIRLAAHWLDSRLPQSNSITHSSCKTDCKAQLQEIVQKYDISYQVQNLLLNSGDCIASLSEIADHLHLSPRTLRRRLDALGTSYNALLVEVRKKLAIRYLLNTPMTTEAISEQLNYSDAANFRHAFKRWTGRSPREYRVLNNGGKYASRFAQSAAYGMA
ncbi:AraC family transcriptional regulator [Pseudomonas capeferrum]|uniref:AraC family transcriptional regulator n=1 Tax=Pseudomonas capeferrum TaxID=1495066 RepID=UPI0015E3C2B2|nr:AraC family transcriptional regulator [Pseudomonas capeferrum]MBA1204780.1 AraC family transcriptional regulator [Pseudomonas capeferrum]